jgi:menaquinone-specific isochorismate synthase
MTVPHLLARRPDLVWVSPTLQIAGWGIAARFDPGTGPGRYQRAWEFVASQPSPEPAFAFASFTFDPEQSGSVVLIPLRVAGKAPPTWPAITPPPPADPGPPAFTDRPRFAGSSLPDHLWLEAVAAALDQIAAGHLQKVVLARDHALWSKQPFDVHRTLARLVERFPECHSFLIEGLVGASPELLIRRQDREVTSRVLAGSSPRHQEPGADEYLGKELLASDKNQREHELAAASVGAALGEVCRRLHRPPVPELLKLDNVQHLSTTFEGTLAHPHHVLELVGRLHPTAAVGGTPTAAAIDLIRRLEGMSRGRYAGPAGVFTAGGDGEFAIALRCAELSGARARLFAGSGLVAGSRPEEELEETRLKLKAMLSALA